MSKRDKITATPFARTFTIDSRNLDTEKRTADLAFSSETTEVIRFFGREILDHEDASVDLSRLNNGAPLLVDHVAAQQVGVVVSAEIGRDRKGRALVRFARDDEGQKEFDRVRDGIRTKVSTGYMVREMEEIESPDDIPTFKVRKWEPYEISTVAIPADDSIGIGRGSEDEYEITVIRKFNKTSDVDMTEKTDAPGKEGEQSTTTVQKFVLEREKAEPGPSAEEIRADTKKAEKDRSKEILALGGKYEMRKDAQDFVDQDKTVAEFQRHVLENFDVTKIKAKEITSESLGLTNKEADSYSLGRAIRNIINGKPGGIEFEVSNAMAKEKGKDMEYGPNRTAITVPHDQFWPEYAAKKSERDLSVGSDTQVIQTSLGDLIDILRARLVVVQAGARVLPGLRDNIDIPRQNAAASAGWVAESTAVAESEGTFQTLSLRPNSVGMYTDYSRKFLLQATIGVENFVREDLAQGIAQAIDIGAINGSGTNDQPTGILNTSGIGSVTVATNGGAVSRTIISSLIREVEIDNAAHGRLGFLTNAQVCHAMRTIRVDSGSGRFILEPGERELFTYQIFVTQNVPSTLTKGTGSNLSAMIFGNFDDLILAFWSGVDVLVDPYSLSTQQAVRIVAMQDADVGVRHAESFSEVNELTT